MGVSRKLLELLLMLGFPMSIRCDPSLAQRSTSKAIPLSTDVPIIQHAFGDKYTHLVWPADLGLAIYTLTNGWYEGLGDIANCLGVGEYR